MTTPLTQLADEQSTRAATALTNLTARLGELDTALAAARTTALATTADLATLRQQEADLRAKLGKVPLPADADALSEELEQTLIAQQGGIAAAAAAADGLATAQRNQNRVAAELARATTARDAAVAATQAVHTDAAQIGTWRATLTGQLVSSVLAAAKAALTGTPFTDARDALFTVLDGPLGSTGGPDAANPLGQGLLRVFAARATEAGQRRKEIADALARARQASWDLDAHRKPLDTTVAVAVAGRDDLVTRLRELATGAITQHAAALASCTAIAAGPAPTSAEQGAMDSNHAAALAAAAEQLKVFAAAATLREKHAALDQAVLNKLAANPAFDPANSADVKTERDAVTDAQTKLDETETAFAAVRKDLDVWEAAVPGETKAQIVAFLDAQDILGHLGADNLVPDLLTKLDAAETALADALRAVDTHQRSAALLADQLAERAGAADAATAVAVDRRAALIRGEG